MNSHLLNVLEMHVKIYVEVAAGLCLWRAEVIQHDSMTQSVINVFGGQVAKSLC